jgi:hypothetical protein
VLEDVVGLLQVRLDRVGGSASRGQAAGIGHEVIESVRGGGLKNYQCPILPVKTLYTRNTPFITGRAPTGAQWAERAALQDRWPRNGHRRRDLHTLVRSEHHCVHVVLAAPAPIDGAPNPGTICTPTCHWPVADHAVVPEGAALS